MKKIKDIVNSSWFKAAAIGGIGVLLLLDKNVFYSGIAFGFPPPSPGNDACADADPLN